MASVHAPLNPPILHALNAYVDDEDFDLVSVAGEISITVAALHKAMSRGPVATAARTAIKAFLDD